VVEFNEFVAAHGECGGWEAEDHAEFVAILKSVKGDYTQAVTATLECCVGYTRAEVMQHARWG
jgi:hypothetical protein